MKIKKVIITNSCNGIDYGDLSNNKKGKALIKKIEEKNLKNLLFFEIRDYIVNEELGDFVKVTFEVPYNVLVKKIRKINMKKKI